jgi:hypothetical protein
MERSRRTTVGSFLHQQDPSPASFAFSALDFRARSRFQRSAHRVTCSASARQNTRIPSDSERAWTGTSVAPTVRVAEVLRWRKREDVPSRHAQKRSSPSSFLPVGAYAGRARFNPRQRAALTPTLERAIGQVIEVGFAGIAAKGEMFAGQALYLEWRSDDVLDGFLIPEQDLEFL